MEVPPTTKPPEKLESPVAPYVMGELKGPSGGGMVGGQHLGRRSPGGDGGEAGMARSLFSNIDTSFNLFFNFHFLDLTILQPVTILTV